MCTPFELMNALGKCMFPRSSSLSSYHLDADGSEESKLVSSLLYELPSLSSRVSARVQAGIFKISRPPTTAPSSYEETFNSVMVLRELLINQSAQQRDGGASECSQIVVRLTSNECAAIRSLCVTLRRVCDDVESAVRSVSGDMSSVIDDAPSDMFELTVAMGSSSGVARLLHLDERLREVISDATTIIGCRAEIYLYISDFITLLHDVCGTRLSSLCRHDLNDIINHRLNAGESAANYTGLLRQRSECVNLLNKIMSSDVYEQAYVHQLLVVDGDAFSSSQVRPATRRERYITPVRSGDIIAAISNLGIYFDSMMMSMWGSPYETSLTWFLRFRNLLTAIIGSGDPLVVYAVLTHVYGPHHIVFTKLRDVNPSLVDQISGYVEADQTADHEFTRSVYKALDPQSIDPKQTSTASRCLRLWLMYQHHRFGQSTYSVGGFTDNIAEILPDEVSRRALDIGARRLETEYLEPMIQDLMRQCGLGGGWPIIKTPRGGGQGQQGEDDVLYAMEMCGFNMTLSELNAKYVNPHRKAGKINFININGSLYGSTTSNTVVDDAGGGGNQPPNPEGVDMTWMDRLATDLEQNNNKAPTTMRTPNETTTTSTTTTTPTPTRRRARTRDEMDRDNRAKLAERERKKAEKQMLEDEKRRKMEERQLEKQRLEDEKQMKKDAKRRKK